MRIGSDEDKSRIDQSAASEGLADLIKEQSAKEETRFSDLDGRKKIGFIWDYYKWWIIGGIAAIIALTTFIRDYRENSKPTYLYVEMLNSYFGADNTNTIYNDFPSEAGIDLTKEHLTIGTEVTLSAENYDTTMLAFQQRLVASYAAQELDVVIGPKNIIEGPANCDNYADLDKILPKDLIDELKDREYEFYIFDPAKDDIEDYEGEDLTPYTAGIYLDNCSYLNNQGEHGAYPVAQTEDDRPVLTIAANSTRIDHAIGFVRFLIHNR